MSTTLTTATAVLDAAGTEITIGSIVVVMAHGSGSIRTNDVGYSGDVLGFTKTGHVRIDFTGTSGLSRTAHPSCLLVQSLTPGGWA